MGDGVNLLECPLKTVLLRLINKRKRRRYVVSQKVIEELWGGEREEGGDEAWRVFI